MGVFHSPRLSTKGLISYIDVSNPKCYISGSANMFDLVDGESYSIGSVGYESSSLKFNGVDERIAFKDFRNVGTDRTIEVYHKPTDSGGNRGIIGQGAQFRIFTTSNNLSVFWYDTTVSSGQVTTDGGEWTNMRNRWNYTAALIDAGSISRLYTNDNYIQATTNLGLYSSSPQTSFLGDIFSGGQYWYQGYISVVRVYNRFLSLDEISLNRLALESKFKSFN